MPSSSSSSSSTFFSSFGASPPAAAPPPPPAAAAPPPPPPPKEASFLEPASIISWTDLPSIFDNTSLSILSSTAMPLSSKSFLTSAADGLSLPPIWRRRYAAQYFMPMAAENQQRAQTQVD